MSKKLGATSYGIMDPKWHGTMNGYSNWKCRCDACKKIAKEYQAIAKAERFARPKTGKEKWHGTYSGYQNWGCRCEPCHEAFKVRAREDAAKIRRKKGLPTRQDLKIRKLNVVWEVTKHCDHGTKQAVQMGCRCDKCSNKITEMQRLVRWNTLPTGNEEWHGTIRGYQFWGCRCKNCYQANSHYRKIQYLNGGNRSTRKPTGRPVGRPRKDLSFIHQNEQDSTSKTV
jgi:hypothetical protein